MARIKYDPDYSVGSRIKYMSHRELCELVGKLCALVRTEVGAGGVRGGIYPDNISMDENGDVALGPAKTSDWDGQELQFSSPELYWNSRRSPASDVYSMGLLLYYGVSRGRLPFEGECSDPLLRRMGGDEFPPPAAASRRLAEIIGKATQFKASDRYQSMEELGVLLDGCVRNLYLNGVPSGKLLFDKEDDDLNELERMMVGIIEQSDAAPLTPVEEPEPVEEEPEAEAAEPKAEAEPPEAAAEEPETDEDETVTGEPETQISAQTPEAETDNVKIYNKATGEDVKDKKQNANKQVVLLREEKNPELAPVVPVKTPAVQYTKSIDREKKIAEEVKKRRRRSVAIILVLCAALVVIAIVFNALLHDLNDVPTPDNAASTYTLSPEQVNGYGYTGGEDGSSVSGDDSEGTSGVIDVNDPNDAPLVENGVDGEDGGDKESEYEIFVEDVSWTEAQARCKAKGGYLAVVTSQAELDEIIALADEIGVQMLWLGCHRVDGALVWETDETVSFYPWGTGEPSLEDTGDNVAEDYLLLWYHSGWVYNDSRNDPVADYPTWYSGNIAYVCEY